MVFELVLILIFTTLLALLREWRKGEEQENHYDKITDENNGGFEALPVLGPWDLLTEVGPMLTVNRHLANYEWADNVVRRLGRTVICKIPMCPRTTIISNDLNFCKKVMSCSSLWPDRLYEPHYMHRSTFDKPLGLLLGSGELREKSSRLTLKLLHQFEFFKPNKMENFISFEMSEIEADLSKRIEASPGGALTFSPHTMFEAATLNVVCQVLFGKRYPAGDPVILDLLKTMNVANREWSMGYTLLEYIPWLKYLPQLTFLHTWMMFSDVCYDFCKDIISEKRKQRRSVHEHPQDFVDAFLQEIDKHEDKMLADQMLLAVLRDMILAGSDTVNSTLEHGILHMSLQQRIQGKVQAEIDEIIGESSAPTYSDKAKMPYTQAVLLEILRVASAVPGTTRATKAQTTCEGYPLQKGSQLVINLYGIHRSKEFWDDPLIFRPERFLSEDGALVNMEKILPFGYGKRSCTGETVAWVTLFIFFVTLLQKFTFEISPDHPAPSFKNPKGLSRCPMPYFVKVRKRAPLPRPL